MANGADGSIVIDTGLDNTGFERGSAKMERAIKGVTQTINQSGRAAASSMQPLFSACQQMGSAAASATQSVNAMTSSMSGALSSSEFGKSMNAAERSCTSLGNQLQRLSDSERMGIRTGAQMTRFQINVEKARDSVERLGQELQNLGGQQVKTPEYEQLAASAQKAEQALFRMYDRRDTMADLGVKESSREWQRLEVQIRNAEYTLNSYEQSMESMRANGTAFVNAQDTARYQQMAATLQDMQAQLARYEQIAAGFDTVSGPAAQSESALKNVDKELQQKPKDAGSASQALQSFGNVLKGAASSIIRMNAAMAKLAFKGISAGAKAAAKNFGKFLDKAKEGTPTTKSLVKSLTSLKTILISRLKRTFISSIVQSVKECLGSLAKFSSAFNASMSSMKNASKGLSANLAVTFGNLVNAVAPAISAIINWISKAISYLNAFFAMLSGKSFVTVAKKQTDSYAKSLGGAAGAAKKLKNEVYGFDELNKASSDDGGGGGSGGTGDLFENVPIESLLPESVQNFFSSIKAAFEAGDWEGIGKIVGNGLNTVVTAVDGWIVSIQPLAVTWASRIAQILNGLVSGINWANMGLLISDGINLVFSTLNTFLDEFNWEALGTNLGVGLNTIFEKTDWGTVGATFGNKWNVLIDTIHGFVTKVNWESLGTSVATGVSKWFSTVNWTGIVGSINASIHGVFTSITTFMSGIDWASAGKTIGGIVNGLDIAGMITSITTSLNTFVTSAFDLAMGILSSVDWKSLGTQFAGIVNGIDLATWISDWTAFITTFVADALTLAAGFIEAIDWTELGNTLWNSVTGYFESYNWEGIVTSAFELLGAAIGGAAALIASLASNIWDAIKQAWEDVKTYFGTYFDQYGGDIIAGLLNGIWNAVCNIGQWIVDNIFTPFINGFKAAFGIASPSTVMEEQGGYIIAGLLQGITTAWESIVEWVTGAVEAFAGFFSGLWETISGAASTAWEGISTTISGVWDGLSTAATTAWEGISTTISGVWDNLTTAASTAWNGISTTISGVWDSLSAAATTAWNGISTTISGVWDGLSTAATTAWNGISTTISGVWDGLSTTATTTWNSISTTVSTVWNNLSTTATTVWDTVKTTISDAWDSVSTKATTVWTEATQYLSDTWDGVKSTADTAWKNVKDTIISWFTGTRDDAKEVDWSGVGEGITTGTEGGITGLWDSFKSRVVNKFKSLVNSVKSTLGIASPSKVFKSIGGFMMEGLNGGIESEEKTVFKTMGNLAKSLADSTIDGPGIEFAGDAVVTGIDRVADKLSGIAEIFAQIASMLNAIGGFKMPAVAAGTAVPYKTRVAAESVSTSKPDPLTTFTTNFDETMSDQRDLLLELIDVLRKKNLVIDGDSIMRALNYLQRSQLRCYGGA